MKNSSRFTAKVFHTCAKAFTLKSLPRSRGTSLFSLRRRRKIKLATNDGYNSRDHSGNITTIRIHSKIRIGLQYYENEILLIYNNTNTILGNFLE